jgi:predicted phosphoribosyltransferase
MFRYILTIGDNQFKDSFRQEADDFLRQEFSSKEYEPLNNLKNNTIILRDVHYETGKVFETMFAEIEKLRKLLPFAEKAYRQSSS